MHTPFFPLMTNEEIFDREARIAQEFHLDCTNMLVQRFMHLSDKVSAIWEAKKKAIEAGSTYIGG